MSENENLEAKYGRRKNASQNQDLNSSKNVSEQADYEQQETNHEMNNTFSKKTKEELTQKQKDIQSSIENVISNYSDKHKYIEKSMLQTKKVKKEESIFVSFIKSILMLGILVMILCICISIYAKPFINAEGEQIVNQLVKAENIYFSAVSKYHFFSKTKYDNTLGVDISNCKFFSSYAVVPNEKSGNYEIKLFGATNAFTMTYYYLKSLINK